MNSLLKYLLHFVKLLSKFFINIEKDNKYKRINIFNIIKINISLKYKMRKEWRKKNADNYTSLKNFEQIDKVVVGRGSYGTIDAEFASLGDEKLIIGNYCSIANGVKFIVASEHFYKGLSTYPFKVFNFKEKAEAISKGDIVLKDDVWIGANAIILSGVTIAQGAIVGAGAVVTKDVPPYAIVGGNPAKIIKYRFEPEIIEKLLKFDFAKLDNDKIEKLGLKLYKKITKENVDELLKEFGCDV